MGTKAKIVFAIITYLIVFGVINLVYLPQGQVLKDWKVLEVDSQREKVDIEAFSDIQLPYTRNISKPGIYEFSTIVFPDNLKSDVLHIRRINGYAFEVSLNGQMIYQQGDMDVPTANLWNHSFLIDIPDSLLHQKNIFVIRVHGLHDIGFIMEPSLGTRSQFNLIVELQNILAEGLSYMIIGASVIIGILMLLLGFKQGKKENYYVQFGLAFLAFSIYNLEFIYREYTGSLSFYLGFRKLIYLAMMYAIGFLITGTLNLLYNYQINLKIKIAYYISLAPLLFMPTFNYLRICIMMYNIVLIVLSIFLVVLVLANPKKKLRFSITFLMITIIHAIVVYLFRIPAIAFINYGISVILIGLTYTVVVDFGQLHTDNKELENKTLIDGLTGAYNREYMDRLNAHEGDCFIFMDIDYFKVYNDTLGHQYGDSLLIELVSYIKSKIRDKDSVIRYGGDEFVIHLVDTAREQSDQKAKLIKKFVQEGYEYVDLSYGISEYKESLHETIRTTDKYMYRMKESKKR